MLTIIDGRHLYLLSGNAAFNRHHVVVAYGLVVGEVKWALHSYDFGVFVWLALQAHADC